MWIIYAHINKINGKRYIGQTKQEPNERWRNGKGYKGSPYFYHAIQKYGWESFEHQIIEKDISTQEEANLKEIYWINIFQSNDEKYGYNLENGGYCYPSHAVEKIKELWKQPEFYEQYCKQVICTNNGHIYKSIAEAARQTNSDKKGIADNCKGKLNSSGTDKETGLPLVWSFYEEGKEYPYIHPLKKSKRARSVICLTTGKIFDSITQAAKYYGIESNAPSISRCCREPDKQKSAGYFNGQPLMWNYYDPQKDYQIGQCYSRTGSKPIKCITTGQIYSSIGKASKETGIPHSNLTACCKGRIKKARGLEWEYYQETEEESDI